MATIARDEVAPAGGAPSRPPLAGRSPAALALLAATACTRAGPPPEAADAPLLAGPPLVAAAAPASSELGALARVIPLGRGHALHVYDRAERQDMSLWTESKGHVWTFPAPRGAVLQAAQIVDPAVIVVSAIGPNRTELIGLDRATGAVRWRTLHAGPHGHGVREGLPDVTHRHWAPDPLSPADHGGFVHALTRRDVFDLVDLDLATGAVRARASTRRAHPFQRVSVRFTPTRVIHDVPRFAGPDPDDPDEEGPRFVVRRRGDLELVGRFEGAGLEASDCLIDERRYAVERDGLVRVALDRPGLPRELLLADPSRPRLLGCDRYGELDIIWLSGQVVAAPPGLGVAWTIDLAGWEVARDRGRAQPLPDFPALWASEPAGPGAALLVLDLRRRALAWAGLADDALRGPVEHDGARSLLWLDRDDAAGSVLLAVDGATGLPGPAVHVEGLDGAHPQTRALVDGVVWLAAPTTIAEGAAPGRWRERWARLDASTLRPLDGASAFTLRDARPWLLGQLQPRFALPVAQRPRTIRRPPPPRPRPAPDRAPGPEPPWDRGPLDAAARELVGARDDAQVWLLAWDVRAGRESEHAVVALEYDDSQRGQMWMIALLRRGRESETLHRFGGVDLGAGEWHAYQPRPAVWPRRRLLPRRPTSRDLEQLLDFADWTMAGGTRDAEALIDGNVIDAAWRAVTGEAPTRLYPPQIEHADE